MSTALVSFYDFGDHCSYRSNSASATLQNSKNGFDRKTSLTSVYNSVQQNNNNNNNNNNNINTNLNSNNVNVITRRAVTTTTSVPISLSHSSHRLQSSNATVSAMHPKSPIGVSNTQPSVALVRGLSTGSHQCSQSNNNNNMNTINGNNNNKEHKKLDRSYSEPAEKTQQLARLNSTTTVAGPMSSRYKTELCRSFAEVGTCKYGDKCQFAHGGHELRVITRHPKFKTENCKSFHSTGFCPYGPRCHFIHNSEESKKCMLNNLSGTGNPNGVTTNGSQTRIGDQIISNSNINANNGFGQTYHSNNNSHPLRPKALSIGSYSLGSSGEISPPSSQSGSPTSLNSFFTEDPFNPFASPSNHALGSCANNAFSFSPDFASLVTTTHNINNKNAGLQTFGGSQPTLCPAFPLATNMNGSDISDQPVVVPTMFPNQFTTSSPTNATLDHQMNEGTQQGMARTTPPPQQTAKVTPVSYPVAPESPVDSIASDVDALKLEQSSPIPTCSSPLEVGKSLPRLPIFTRFANNGNNDLE